LQRLEQQGLPETNLSGSTAMNENESLVLMNGWIGLAALNLVLIVLTFLQFWY